MGSQILRPTTVKRQKGEWLIQGPWGRRNFPSMSRVDLYGQLRHELIASDVLPVDSPEPSNRYHDHVTMTVMTCSWIEGQWVSDEPFAARLKKLRDQAKLTQEQLADKSSLDVGTIRQLEQGTRTNPLWQTVCALARGLQRDVVVFVGTDGWQPPDPDKDWKSRQA
ncbi:MAG: helix-turn-helix domain-containing protein [Anaerolineae bacterium]|nr:helix-turn-helix domain-containing protein [Anaerolineae bacterium]